MFAGYNPCVKNWFLPTHPISHSIPTIIWKNLLLNVPPGVFLTTKKKNSSSSVTFPPFPLWVLLTPQPTSPAPWTADARHPRYAAPTMLSRMLFPMALPILPVAGARRVREQRTLRAKWLGRCHPQNECICMCIYIYIYICVVCARMYVSKEYAFIFKIICWFSCLFVYF